MIESKIANPASGGVLELRRQAQPPRDGGPAQRIAALDGEQPNLGGAFVARIDGSIGDAVTAAPS